MEQMDIKELVSKLMKELLDEQQEKVITKVEGEIVEETITLANDKENTITRVLHPLSGCGCLKSPAVKCEYISCTNVVCNDCHRTCSKPNCQTRLCRSHQYKVGENIFCPVHVFTATIFNRISKIWRFFHEG